MKIYSKTAQVIQNRLIDIENADRFHPSDIEDVNVHIKEFNKKLETSFQELEKDLNKVLVSPQIMLDINDNTAHYCNDAREIAAAEFNGLIKTSHDDHLKWYNKNHITVSLPVNEVELTPDLCFQTSREDLNKVTDHQGIERITNYDQVENITLKNNPITKNKNTTENINSGDYMVTVMVDGLPPYPIRVDKVDINKISKNLLDLDDREALAVYNGFNCYSDYQSLSIYADNIRLNTRNNNSLQKDQPSINVNQKGLSI